MRSRSWLSWPRSSPATPGASWPDCCARRASRSWSFGASGCRRRPPSNCLRSPTRWGSPITTAQGYWRSRPAAMAAACGRRERCRTRCPDTLRPRPRAEAPRRSHARRRAAPLARCICSKPTRSAISRTAPCGSRRCTTSGWWSRTRRSSPTGCANMPASYSRRSHTPRRKALSSTPMGACSGCEPQSAIRAKSGPDGGSWLSSPSAPGSTPAC